jgi:hypothetical protein
MAREITGIFIGIFLALFIMASVSAASSISISRLTYNYRVGSPIEIRNPCYYNGNNCPSATNCNITVYDPSNVVIVNNQQMTYGGPYFNYTLPGLNYSIGSYKCDMVCTYSGVSGSQRFYLDIGSGGSTSLFLILAFASLLILVVAIVMKNEYIGFASGALFIITGLFSIIYGIGNLSNMYTDSIGYVSLGLGLMFLVAAGYSAASGSGLFSGEDEGYEDSLMDDVWGQK